MKLNMKLNTKGCEKVAARLKEITTFVYEEFARQINTTDCTELFELFEVSDFELVPEDGNNSNKEIPALTELSIYRILVGKASMGVPPTAVYSVMPTIEFIFENKAKEAWLEDTTARVSGEITRIIETTARVKFNSTDTILAVLDRGTQKRNGIRKFFLKICISIIVDDTEYVLM